MIIQKELPLVQLKFDTESGTLWINSLKGCVLRLNKITTQNKNSDIFESIDIYADNAQAVYNFEENIDDQLKSIEEVLMTIFTEISSLIHDQDLIIKHKEEILTSLKSQIQTKLNELKRKEGVDNDDS